MASRELCTLLETLVYLHVFPEHGQIARDILYNRDKVSMLLGTKACS
jgi:hypothetical protein